MAWKIEELRIETLKLLEFLKEEVHYHKETVKEWQHKQQILLEQILALAKNFSPRVDISSPEIKVLSKIPFLSKRPGVVVGMSFMKQLIELIEFLVEHVEVGIGLLMGIMLVLAAFKCWFVIFLREMIEYINKYTNEFEVEDTDSPF